MNKVHIVLNLFKIFFLSFIYKKKIFIVGTPVHGNLGDQALLYAEEKMILNTKPKYKIIEIPSSIASKLTNIISLAIRANDIYIQAGGFLGNLWMNEEIMFRNIIKRFKNNKIVVLPQTVFFTNDYEGQKEYKKSKAIYESHNNLTFILREYISYNYMKTNFSKCKIDLKPDMALYLNKNDFIFVDNKKVNRALFCIRKDKEKIKYDFNNIKKILKHYGITEIKETDTVINKNIYNNKKRIKYLTEKINDFRNSEIIITDRLHGMIFALISNKPCLVYQNKSPKILGVYEWIKDCGYIKLYDKKREDDIIYELLNNNCSYDNIKLKKELQKIMYK